MPVIQINRIAVSVDGLGAENEQRIREVAHQCGAQVDFIAEDARDKNARVLEVDVLFGHAAAAVVESSTLRFVQLNSSGFDPYCTPALISRAEFVLANARGATSRAVAEHALSMIFAFVRQLPFHEGNQHKRTWRRATSYELVRDCTITIIGTGAIGTELGGMCQALGARVLTVQRNLTAPNFAVRSFPLTDFDEALHETNHLVICLPVIGLEKPLVGESELRQMPHGAFVYNMSRANLLDYEALQRCLVSGHLGGAGLDVFPEEPLPESNPLWQMDNVLVSPHAGGRFDGEMNALTDLFLFNLEKFRLGLPMRNLVIGAQNWEKEK